MQSIYAISGIILIVVVILLIVLAPSTRGRGYRTKQEKAEYDLERNTPIDDVERHRRRYHF